MPSPVLEPGQRLVERYLLEHRLSDSEHAAFWRANDELLDRPVGLYLLPATAEHADRVLTAARRAATLSDPRFLRVLDASRLDDVVYVVSEWITATDLAELLVDGPLPPADARAVGLEVAGALAAAHRAGLSHLCLTPENVLRTSHGQIKISGLAVDAAVRGLVPDSDTDAERRDAAGAAAVVYAALTARWPGSEATHLPPAPFDGPDLCSPRQVRAGVPADLDGIISRTLGIGGEHPDRPVTAAALADQIAKASNGFGGAGARPGAAGRAGEVPGYPLAALAADEPGPRRRSRPALLAWVAAGLVLAVGLVLAATQLVLAVWDDPEPPGSAGGSQQTRSAPPPEDAPTGRRLPVRGVTGFDPEGDGEENDEDVGLVVDRDPATVWLTNFYNDPFGPAGLKEGVGLVLDLGQRRSIGSVRVRTVGGATDFEVYASDAAAAQLTGYAPLTSRPARDVDGPATVVPQEKTSARYVLVWLTALPVDSDGTYRGRIAEVTVHD